MLPVSSLLLSLIASGAPDGPEPIPLARYIAPSSLLLPAVGFDAWSSVAMPPWGPCEHSAWIARRAARKDARAESLLEIAKCVQEGGPMWSCALQAQGDLFEALQLIEQVHDERLTLCQLLGSGAYDPELDPARFCSSITNPFLPFVPGRRLIYREVTPEGIERIKVKLRPDTIEIAGITCAVVRDVVRIDGELLEDTDDWYAQDQDGNVWYVGEIAKNYEDGRLVDLDGSWATGVDGAKAGIVMPADPQVGDCYRQEFLLGEAEDVACVIAIDGTADVPYGNFTGCVVTEDYTPLEPGVRERKYYAAGIGVVLAINLDTGDRSELVQVVDP